MKKLIFISLFFIIACTNEPLETITKSTDKKEISIVSEPEPLDSNTVIKSNAPTVLSFEDNAESVVKFFFASLIRGDHSWEDVCKPIEERSTEFSEAVKDLEQKKLYQYVYQHKDCIDNTCNVHALVQYSENGIVIEIEYVVIVERVDDSWIIVGTTDKV